MSAVVHQAQHPTLSHGERVSPQATGEGVRRPLFPLTFPPTPPRSRIRLTRTASSESPHPAASQPPSPHGRGFKAVPDRIRGLGLRRHRPANFRALYTLARLLRSHSLPEGERWTPYLRHHLVKR